MKNLLTSLGHQIQDVVVAQLVKNGPCLNETSPKNLNVGNAVTWTVQPFVVILN